MDNEKKSQKFFKFFRFFRLFEKRLITNAKKNCRRVLLSEALQAASLQLCLKPHSSKDACCNSTNGQKLQNTSHIIANKLRRGVFRTESNIYDGDLRNKQLRNFSCSLFSQQKVPSYMFDAVLNTLLQSVVKVKVKPQ